MIDEFNLGPPAVPLTGIKYLTNAIGSSIALLIKDTPNSLVEGVRQFFPGDVITEDMLNLSEDERNVFIKRYIASGILSDNELIPTPPTVGIDSISTCNYSILLNDNSSANKTNISYEATSNHLQIFTASYKETIVAVYYRDSDGISYSLDNGKNIIKITGTLENNLEFPEEITSCAALVYTDTYNSSLVKTKLYIGTLREGLKSISPGQTKFIQETDLEKGRFIGSLEPESYFFRSNKWNVSKIKSSSGEYSEFLAGPYQPCYVIGILNHPKELNNPILIYVKNTIVDNNVTSTIENLQEVLDPLTNAYVLDGTLKISGTVIKPRYTFFTKKLTADSNWQPFYASNEVKLLDICDVLRSTDYNSVLDFSKVTPLEVGLITAVACPKNYINKYVTRLLKYYYNTSISKISLDILPIFSYMSINIPDLIDTNDQNFINDRASITINGTTHTLLFNTLTTFESQWLNFIESLKPIYPTISFIVSSTYELRIFSNASLIVSVDRFKYLDLDIEPKNLTGLSCYYDFESFSETRNTIFLTEYDKIWKLGNFPSGNWGSGPWMSSDSLSPKNSFRLDKNLNFTFLNLENKFESDQISATTTYLNGLRNFCIYKPNHVSSYIGYCGSDMGLIRFEFIYNPLENDNRFLNKKLPHRFDKRLYSSWNTDLVFDLPSKTLIGCGLASHPPIIYDFESTTTEPVRYYYFEPTFATKKSVESGIILSKTFYKNYFASYITQAGFPIIETPVESSLENMGSIAFPYYKTINRYSAINSYNFRLFQDLRRDQVIKNDSETKDFVRIIPRFVGSTSFVNTIINSSSKYSFINIKSDLYTDISTIPLSVEYPINSGIIRILSPSHINYDESNLIFSVGDIDFISLQNSRNALAKYLNNSMVKYNKYKLKLRAVESPGKVFNSNINYASDAEFLLVLNEGI